MATNTPCDEKIFKKGSSVALLDARSNQAEAWVRKVADRSGQKVDWHYSGGIANVLFLGDREQVIKAIESMPEQADVRVMRIYHEQADGPYRAGVTAAPSSAVAGWTDPDTGSPVFIVNSDKKKPSLWRWIRRKFT